MPGPTTADSRPSRPRRATACGPTSTTPTLAHEISPSSLRESKRQLWSDLLRPLDEAMRHSIALLDRMVAEPDFREGAAALAERRPPRF